MSALTGEPLNQQQMYVRCNLPVPDTPPSGFELVVPGRDDHFVTIETLGQFERVTTELVLECAGNGRTLMSAPIPEGAPWALDAVSAITVGGHRLSDLLGRLPDDIVEVVFTGADTGTVDDAGRVNYQFSIDRQLAESPVPILATHIGDEPLDLLHGAPVRLVVPGHYAMKSVKWLTRVEAVTEPFRGHFVERYRYFGDTSEEEGAPVADIAVRSVIASPADGERTPAGIIEIRGSAWSGSGKVIRVEVSVDGEETWEQATLEPSEGRWSPVGWVYRTEAVSGPLEVRSRATDDAGNTQPLQPRWNGNGYANNVVPRITVQVA
jgi:DMSO/TMAO reductase YedYZ molybdopterin-dependent catalytic subunit